MKIVTDRDLILDARNYDVILLGVNIMNTKGNGFNHKMFQSMPEVYEAHRDTPYGDKKKLGTVVWAGENPKVAICYISEGRYRPDKKPDTVDYSALERCLAEIDSKVTDERIACTILGASPFEGGGNKDYILSIFQKSDKEYILYDYEQIDYRIEDNITYKGITEDYKAGKITLDEFYERKKQYMWRRKYGYFTPPPACSYRQMMVNFKKERENKI